MALNDFSPLVREWFETRFAQPTLVQSSAWPLISAGHNVLVYAPTGEGKSLAAWLPLVDRLCGQKAGKGVRVLYISPLRALSRDMAAGILDFMEGLGSQPATAAGARVGPSIGLRTGDTSAGERDKQRRNPPEILLTTPESLFVLLGSAGGRAMLATVETVIIDEIHALIGNKRGAHLSLSLERLEAHAGRPLQRIGLSATARPVRLVAGFLVGAGRDCRIVSPEAHRPPEVIVEMPAMPLGPFAHSGHWRFVAERLQKLALLPGNMLVFCNTRGLVERVAGLLAEALEESRIAAHHGSIGRKRRQQVEEGLKLGHIKVVVCSSSLELGIDIGVLDRVCQLGSTGAINTFRQRAGRARHRPGAVPRIHAFPLNLADLLETRALIDALQSASLDRARLCRQPMDVLAQHVVAMVAAGQGGADSIFGLARRALPWRRLDRDEFEASLDMLHQGYVPGRETGCGPVFRSGQGRLEAATNADKRSLLNAGTIPEWFEYEVVAADEGRILGRLDEEFAFESSPGQIMQLGGQNWRILRVSTGRVDVEAADDQTPNLPFWFGEGPGRSAALSGAVQAVCAAVGGGGRLADTQLQDYLATSLSELGRLPGRNRIVLERFYDPGGDQHLVIHSLHGARINRAWGLALRKRFCRTFNFELQAAAIDNGLLISLGAVHSFDLPEVIGWLKSSNVAEVLTQAMLDTPIFQTRLRWCATTALAIERRNLRGRVPAQIQRNQTENLIARIFPDQLACLENLSGERRIPDHPLVQQALRDCLEDFMDLPGLERLYRAMEAGRVTVHGVDTAQPSPLARALIHAPRHSFLDPAAAEERRTRTFESQPPGKLTPAPPRTGQTGFPRNLPTGRAAFERELLAAGYLMAREGEAGGASRSFMALVHGRQAFNVQTDPQRRFWVHIERLAELRALWPTATIKPFLPSGSMPAALDDTEEALCRLVLGRLRHLGKLSVNRLAEETGLAVGKIEAALQRLRLEGQVSCPKPGAGDEWLERKPFPG